jgi:FdhD protein
VTADGAAATALVRRFDIKRIEQGCSERRIDTVAAEEPLQIRLKYWFKDASVVTPLALTMRTPGHDREFAAGYLFTEGIIEKRQDIEGLHSIGTEPSNEIVAQLAKGVDVDTWMLNRNGPLNASCGICGKRSVEALSTYARPLREDGPLFTSKLIESLPPLLRSHQAGFGQTGGLHAAALIAPDGSIQATFEDIGRHNALDKLIGYEFLGGRTPLSNSILFLSSRSSFELVQKAMMAGAPVLATVGGPSSLAIETARSYGLTLIGFVRGERFNVYSGEWRLHS